MLLQVNESETSTVISVTRTALDFTLLFVLTGNVRISDLGLAVELAEDQFKTKGYAGTPGTVETIIADIHLVVAYSRICEQDPHLQNQQLYSIYSQITVFRLYSCH